MNSIVFISSIFVVFVCVYVNVSSAFSTLPFGRKNYNSLLRQQQSLKHNPSELLMKSGGHGQGFKFLPIIKGSNDEYFPRILPIAGIYPSLTPAQLLGPAPAPTPAMGTWAYEFTDPNGSQLGTVALPGSEVLHVAVDPVVLITTNTDLGVSVVEEVEMLVVIDRGDRDFASDKFYIFKTPQNTLTILWSDDIPPGHEIMGRVVICTVPFTEAMKSKPTGFLEDDGDSY